jgi:hypothetical protein
MNKILFFARKNGRVHSVNSFGETAVNEQYTITNDKINIVCADGLIEICQLHNNRQELKQSLENLKVRQ